jgi:hypothetical protein
VIHIQCLRPKRSVCVRLPRLDMVFVEIQNLELFVSMKDVHVPCQLYDLDLYSVARNVLVQIAEA